MFEENTEAVLVETENHEIDEHNLQRHLAEATTCGQLGDAIKHIRVRISIQKSPGGEEKHFVAPLSDTVGEVFQHAAKVLGEHLLPPAPAEPLDYLRQRRHHEWSSPLTHLDQPLWHLLAHHPSRHFSIEYRLVIKINTKWGVAPSDHATPRDLLTAFGFDPAQYSLYHGNSKEPLPPDTPIHIKRGVRYEAQGDGRYGDSTTPRPARGAQTIEDDVKEAKEAGIDASLLNINGQKYVEVGGLAIPSPPWKPSEVRILIAVPSNYPSGLDAFYVDASVTHDGGSIPRQQGITQIGERSWILISWHYATHRPWNPRHDDLLTHIEHCRGFFLERGVTQ